MPFLPSLPKGATLLDLFKAFPQTSTPLLQFHEVLLRGPSPFTEGERELIAAYVSGLNRCRYCHGVHVATAELLGMPLNSAGSAIDDIETAPVEDKIKPVLRYARENLQYSPVVRRSPTPTQYSPLDGTKRRFITQSPSPRCSIS